MQTLGFVRELANVGVQLVDLLQLELQYSQLFLSFPQLAVHGTYLTFGRLLCAV